MLNLEHHNADLKHAKLHYVTAGAGEPLVLLHGWPQTWHCWRGVMERLSGGFRLIVPDLTGLGDSESKTGKFDKRSVAADILELLVEKLGLSEFHLAGHDWGGAVAWAIAAHFPGHAKTLTLVDITIPGDGNADISAGGSRWHHGFHRTPDLPEQLISGREEIYLRWFYEHYGHRTDAFAEAEIAEYVRCYSKPGVLHAGFEYYRAVTQDVEDNSKRSAVYRPDIPILAVGGGTSWGRGSTVALSARQLADNVTEVVVPDSGHWVPEEQPEKLSALIRDFCALHTRQ